MTHQPSNVGRRAVALLLGVALLSPTAFVFAREANEGPRGSDGTNVRAQIGGGANFCASLDALAGNITTRIPKRQDKRDDRSDKRIVKVGERFELRLGKLDDRREDWDKNRTDRYAKLGARATTTAQIAAFATFKTNVDAAVTVRRTAVDAAVKAFQDGVNKVLADRQVAVDAAFAALKTSTDAAIAKAKASCAGGTDPKTVRETLRADLKVANDAFKAAVKPSDTVESNVKALRTTRDAAVKAAIAAFEVTMKAELAKLKIAFGSTT